MLVEKMSTVKICWKNINNKNVKMLVGENVEVKMSVKSKSSQNVNSQNISGKLTTVKMSVGKCHIKMSVKKRSMEKMSTNFHYSLLCKLSFVQSKHSLNSTDSTTHTHTHTHRYVYTCYFDLDTTLMNDILSLHIQFVDILTTEILSANILTTEIFLLTFWPLVFSLLTFWPLACCLTFWPLAFCLLTFVWTPLTYPSPCDHYPINTHQVSASCSGQRNRCRPAPVPGTGVHYNILFWMCTLYTKIRSPSLNAKYKATKHFTINVIFYQFYDHYQINLKFWPKTHSPAADRFTYQAIAHKQACPKLWKYVDM